ncbi:hypothetical protein Y032_0014g2232 [Ancylostoma ceylanicum]|nr:hypothetical protein Y032_0014g2232 [Ancylostoma ceylanicum]
MHTNVSVQSTSEKERCGDMTDECTERRRSATTVTITEQAPSPCIPTEYSPNTGNRLNNNDLELSSCEGDGHSAKTPKLVVDTVVRSPDSLSGRVCGVTQCEPPGAHGKHQKCSIL